MDLKDALKKYKAQKNNANSRGIGFEISFDEWVLVWGQSGHWSERGKGKNKYVMSRHNDVGPYAIWNVSIKSQEENSHEANAGDRNPAKRSGHLVSAALKGKPKSLYCCSVCNQQVGGKSNLLRWHNNNCRKLNNA